LNAQLGRTFTKKKLDDPPGVRVTTLTTLATTPFSPGWTHPGEGIFFFSKPDIFGLPSFFFFIEARPEGGARTEKEIGEKV